MIIVAHGVRKEIGARLGVSQPTVRRALRGASDTAAARRVRHVAVKEYGGVAVVRRK